MNRWEKTQLLGVYTQCLLLCFRSDSKPLSYVIILLAMFNAGLALWLFCEEPCKRFIRFLETVDFVQQKPKSDVADKMNGDYQKHA